MPKFFVLDRCPWCKTATPTLENKGNIKIDVNSRVWCFYQCSKCLNIVMALHRLSDRGTIDPGILDHLPKNEFTIDDNIPGRARALIQEAHDTIHSPNASIMVSASALDIMLHEIGRPKSEGSLNRRIEIAAEQQQITEAMAQWAHQVRLEANDSRHPDGDGDRVASTDDAEQSLEFVISLAEILFVLPARVQRGIDQTAPQPEE